jgi:hypothetical protein
MPPSITITCPIMKASVFEHHTNRALTNFG